MSTSRILALVLAVVLIVIIVAGLQMTKRINTAGQDAVEVDVMDSARVREKAGRYEKAKELTGIAGYLNTDKITIGENVGKNVVLVDFWTYSCINCQRTLPYLNAWWSKYKDKGLVIIGVHTPEFEFEKDYENVKRATEKYNVKYPVVQDNDYKTWQAYRNRYWPRKYLIDIDGFIVYDHIGEGSYDEIEKKIQELLEERNKVLGLSQDVGTGVVTTIAGGFSSLQTPEIYFGLLFSRNQLGNQEGWQAAKTVSYSMPSRLARDKFYLEGSWLNNQDNMELVSQEGRIKLVYYARKVNLVAGSEQPISLQVYLDGRLYKNVEVSEYDLYNLVDLSEYGQHELEIKIAEPGLMAYTFTFG